MEGLILGEGQTGQGSQVAESGDTGGGDGSTTESAATDQTQEQESSEDTNLVKDVPEQLKAKEKELLQAFHKKTQELSQKERQLEAQSASYKRDAETMYKLADQPWFKSALEKQRSSKNGPGEVSISDEEFQTLTTNRPAFEQFLTSRDKQLYDAIMAQMESRVGTSEKSNKEIKDQLEYDKTAKTFPEFSELHESGALEPWLKKGHSYEDAYGLYKFSQGENPQKVRDEAARLIAAKKNGSINKDGISGNKGGPVVKAKNISQAIDRAFELISKGQKDFRIEKS